ncbi:MAG: P44/Msp2 family outer membrane protein [Pseudomonadota bacterium]
MTTIKLSCAVGVLGAAALVLTPVAASAGGDTYISISGGLSLLGDSDNDGAFDGDFTTGTGATIPAGVVLPDGSPVGWTTEFDAGFAISGAVGKRFGPFRGELEVAYQNNGVDTHLDVVASDIALGAEDAGVLITGSDALGVGVADLVADGQGDLSTVYVMANAYYDLQTGAFSPYVGAGVGIGFTDVEYVPSAVSIIDDNATAFAYQIMVGASYAMTDATDLFVGYRYRGTTDVSVEADLFAADFDIENRGSLFEAGVRFNF